MIFYLKKRKFRWQFYVMLDWDRYNVSTFRHSNVLSSLIYGSFLLLSLCFTNFLHLFKLLPQNFRKIKLFAIQNWRFGCSNITWWYLWPIVWFDLCFNMELCLKFTFSLTISLCGWCSFHCRWHLFKSLKNKLIYSQA